MPTLTLEAELPWVVEHETGLHADKSGVNGPVPIASQHKRVRRVWTLSLGNALDDVRQALDVAHDASRGGADVFDWTPPGEASPISVRFLPGMSGYRRQRVSRRHWQIAVALQEAMST